MLLSVSFNNCLAFDRKIEFSMRADMRQKRFSSNVITDQGVNAVKSALIIGPNNAGKTNFVRGLAGIKSILLNQGLALAKNLFTGDELSCFSIGFIESGTEYYFEVKMNLLRAEYVSERLIEVSYDKYKNRKERIIYVRNNLTMEYICENDVLREMMSVTGRSNLLFYLLDTSKFAELDRAKNVITSFAQKIDVVDMNNIPIQKTIDMMKSDSISKKKIVEFVLSADLSMDDFRYLSDDEVRINFEGFKSGDSIKPQENALAAAASIVEMLHLSSVYHGIPVPSYIFDSTGTKKIAAIASYVIDALDSGRILVVDELDNSLHSKLTRAILALFNNDLNHNAQLICTAHDVTLLDCKKLFRKEQIWFAHKDASGIYLYSLAEFTAEKDGVRDTTDLIEKYKEGVFGALPEPDLFKSLMEVRSNV